MGKKDDAIAGLNALTEKTIENVKLVLNHYGFDSYERKAKVLEDMLNIHRDWDGIDRKTRFEMLAQYFIEQRAQKKENKKQDKPKREKVVTFKVPNMSLDSCAKYIIEQLFDENEEASLQVERQTKIKEIIQMIDDFNDDEIDRIHYTLAELHKKYELSDEEKAFRAMCSKFNLNEEDDLARSVFFAGLNFARNV